MPAGGSGKSPRFVGGGLKKDKRALQLDQFVGDEEHRNRQGLCHDISLKPYLASQRVAVIDYADTFNTSTANALLKTLEEPPPHSLIILLGTSETRQLPTIRSRAQIVRLPLGSGPSRAFAHREEPRRKPPGGPNRGRTGRRQLEQAVEMGREELWQVHTTAVDLLNRPVIDSVKLAALVHQYSNSAGKEAPARRSALVAVLGLVARHFRRQLRGSARPARAAFHSAYRSMSGGRVPSGPKRPLADGHSSMGRRFGPRLTEPVVRGACFAANAQCPH